MTPEQIQRLETLERKFKLLEASGTIPQEVDVAFRTRLKGLIALTVSGKGATSESQTVQESGSLTYGVLKNPDEYLQITVGGATKYIPTFL